MTIALSLKSDQWISAYSAFSIQESQTLRLEVSIFSKYQSLNITVCMYVYRYRYKIHFCCHNKYLPELLTESERSRLALKSTGNAIYSKFQLSSRTKLPRWKKFLKRCDTVQSKLVRVHNHSPLLLPAPLAASNPTPEKLQGVDLFHLMFMTYILHREMQQIKFLFIR